MKWLVILIASAKVTAAYPHFQLTSGSSQCGQCHISPAGGGLLSAWGRDAAGDLSMTGGDGRFLHGAVELPSWLALGGDLRFAVLANDTGSSDGTELAVFPMQADLSARAIAGNSVSVVAVLGARGAVRSGQPDSPPADPPAGTAASPSLRSYFIARELYAVWYAEDQGGPYARIGRFAAPYGLRLADHTAYVRRYLGYNLLEETLGIGGGWIGAGWEIHATAFAHDALQDATREEKGGALMFEVQPGDVLVLGASVRAGFGADDTRLQAGVHGKVWLEGAKLLLQGELDGVRQMFDAGGNRYQLAAYVGPVLIPTQGLYTGIAYEAFAEDLAVRGVLRQAIAAWVSLFPRAHWEVMLSGRGQRIGPDEHALVGMLQLHYTI